MLHTRLFRLVHDKSLSVPIVRYFHHEFSQSEPKSEAKENEAKEKDFPEKNTSASSNKYILTGAMSQKFKVFREKESPEILDIYEEKERYQMQDESDEIVDDACVGLNLKSKCILIFINCSTTAAIMLH